MYQDNGHFLQVEASSYFGDIVIRKVGFLLIKFDSLQLSEDFKITQSGLKEQLPLILLWNNYQLTGSRVYETIFHRITSGKCKVVYNKICNIYRVSQKKLVFRNLPYMVFPVHFGAYLNDIGGSYNKMKI